VHNEITTIEGVVMNILFNPINYLEGEVITYLDERTNLTQYKRPFQLVVRSIGGRVLVYLLRELLRYI